MKPMWEIDVIGRKDDGMYVVRRDVAMDSHGVVVHEHDWLWVSIGNPTNYVTVGKDTTEQRLCIVIHPKIKEVTYLKINPMGELSGRNKAILKHWKSFLTMLSSTTRSSHKDADEWKMAAQNTPTQSNRTLFHVAYLCWSFHGA